MKEVNKHCPNCGAPLTTEICPYCRNVTGLNTRDADMEYPVIECKEANINFGIIIVPIIFAVAFGFFGFIFPIIAIINDPETGITAVLGCSLFAIIGVVAAVIAIKPIIRYCKVKAKGKETDATVYGYMNDNLIINGAPAQIVKLLVTTKDGPRFILYQLGDTKKPYQINSKIKLIVYKNIFMVKQDKKHYFE